ncbi:polar amino acid transport system substrate-binding protein [Lachnospiraceae bacterium C10]|nr:polar amino acid transport system substrate-binding protein [Lachnospiraceae bacterium C10]
MKKKRLYLPVLLAAFTLMTAFSGCGSDKKSHIVKQASDLAGAKIGVQVGTTGDAYVTENFEKKKGTDIQRYDKGADAVQALKQGKIDTVVIDDQVAKAFAEKNPELSILDEDLVVEQYATVFAKGKDELRDKFNKGLAAIKANGTLDKITDTWIKGEGDYHYKKKVTTGDKLVVASSIDFPPYESFDGEGNIVGFDVEMLYAVTDQMGVAVEIQNIQFDSIIAAVDAGKADIGVSGFTITEDRKKSIDFSESYIDTAQVMMVKGGNTAGAVSFKEKFHNNFIKDGRWHYLVRGLGYTLLITFFAVIVGILFGFLLAVIRVAYDKNGSLPVLNCIAKLYLTIVRGTPVMVQLLIIYYVVFASVNISKVFVAIVAFGLNSAAYVAEIIRSGIMSIDDGQFEAGKSLGLKFHTVMIYVILPQAFKNVLPALANEFISLLKETSISGYIGLSDLTRGGQTIQSLTYDALLPLGAVAIVYLVLVVGLSTLVGKLERGLKKNER